MKVSDVSFEISAILSRIGITDAMVEQTQGPTSKIIHFDIQRSMVNGEELWFCFRITFLEDLCEFGIATRHDLDCGRDNPEWRVMTEDAESFRFWLRLYMERDSSILEELTRP